jgi:hypothetical protein
MWLKVVERRERNNGVGEDGKSGFGKYLYTMLDDAPRPSGWPTPVCQACL